MALMSVTMVRIVEIPRLTLIRCKMLIPADSSLEGNP